MKEGEKMSMSSTYLPARAAYQIQAERAFYLTSWAIQNVYHPAREICTEQGTELAYTTLR